MKDKSMNVNKWRSPVNVLKFRVLLFFLIAFVFPSERMPKRVPSSCMATQERCSCLWGEHCVRWWGEEILQLALEVRRGFIFLGRPLSNNILLSALTVCQVLTRQSLFAVRCTASSLASHSSEPFTYTFKLAIRSHIHAWIINKLCSWHFLGTAPDHLGDCMHHRWIYNSHELQHDQ